MTNRVAVPASERPLPPTVFDELVAFAEASEVKPIFADAVRIALAAKNRAVLADRAAQPVRMLTAAECHAVRDEAFPNEPAPLVGFAQAVIRKFCEVNGIVPLAPAQTKEGK